MLTRHSCGRIFWVLLYLFMISCVFQTLAKAAECDLRIEVDARDLPRRLLHTNLKIACKPGPLSLWYPKWIPGTHAPCGPLDTVGGLRLTTDDGRTIAWHRDPLELYRVSCIVPEGCREIHIQLDTICNAPAVDASGHLSFGNGSVGIINWPTCLLYPEGPTAQETRVHLALRLPERWRYATALKSRQEKEGLSRSSPSPLPRWPIRP